MTVHDVARQLPEPAVLREHCRSLAVLESILSPEWADRYHSFDAHWSEGEAMASMQNGAGDEYSIVFSAAGVYMCGFDHESPMSPYEADGPWPGVLDEVPDVFRQYVEEPAFSDEEGMPVVTACIWRQAGDEAWRTGTIEFPDEPSDDPDGSGYLFQLLVDRSPEVFQAWSEDYFETSVDLEAVRHVLASRPLTDAVVGALNPEIGLTDLSEELKGIGYPIDAV